MDNKKKTSAIIIDDMQLARKALRADLEFHCPQIEIIGEADSVISGSKLIRQMQPDITFLDIHLGDGDGFDILEILPDTGTRVIFITASDQHAIQAFKFSAVDYLLKPVDPESLKAAVDKAVDQIDRINTPFQVLKENISTPTKLALHTAEMIKVADLSDIIRLEAMGNYTYFYFTDGSKLLVTRTLKEFNDMLPDHSFIRVHQSHLINLNHLKAYIKTEGGYLLMEDNTRIPVSVRKKSMVIQSIDQFARKG